MLSLKKLSLSIILLDESNFLYAALYFRVISNDVHYIANLPILLLYLENKLNIIFRINLKNFLFI
jgi:hypothetical protein